MSFFGNSPEQPSIDDSRESDMYSDESGTEAETDIDYSTESETEVETDVDYCDTDDLLKRFTIAIINRVLTPFNIHLYCSPNSPGSNLPLHRSKKFIVFEDCLMVLFKKYQNCGDETNTTTTRVIGTFLNVIQHCSKCFFTYKWDSQPVIKDIPAGNILLSASILFSGSLPAKVLQVLRIYGCASISYRTYFRHQGSFLQPAICTAWNKHQADLFKQLRREKRPLIIGGDGRADSPGHSAKFGSYTVMELNKNIIIDIQLVQVSACT